MYCIGIDGGGTKTKMTLFDDNGIIINEVILPTVYILTQDKEQCIKILSQGVSQLDPEEKAFVLAGLAGYGQQSEVQQEIEKVCQIAFGKRRFSLFSDVRIALAGALDNQDGIVIIAGTGSIAVSIQNNQMRRCGGWGYQLGDEGSAYWIAKEMLKIYCQQVDGRLERTVLYYKIIERCHLKHDYDIITYIKEINNDRTIIASLADINGEAAKLNDKYALKIYEKAAKELSSLVRVLAKDFSSPVYVSYIGGVFNNAKEYILEPLQQELKDMCQIIPPTHTPEYGAYLLSKKLR